MTTVKFKGKVYAVVPDGPGLAYEATACSKCVFLDDMDHRCANEEWEGEPFSDGPAVSCLDGFHHYEELPQ
jgi:hypothetical protein